MGFDDALFAKQTCISTPNARKSTICNASHCKWYLTTIKNNFPLDYDLDRLSIDFVKELVNVNSYRIVSGSGDGSIKIWDNQTGQLVHTLNGHTKSVYSVAFSNRFLTDLDRKLIYYLDKIENKL